MLTGTVVKLIMLYFLTLNFGVVGTCIAVILGETINLIIQALGILDIGIKLKEKFYFEILILFSLIIYHSIAPSNFIFSIILCLSASIILLIRFLKDYKKLI